MSQLIKCGLENRKSSVTGRLEFISSVNHFRYLVLSVSNTTVNEEYNQQDLSITSFQIINVYFQFLLMTVEALVC
jgi:hypothetical protein